jgi:hypothetical protein
MNDIQAEILLKDLDEWVGMDNKTADWKRELLVQNCEAALKAHEAAIEILNVYSRRLLITEKFCPGVLKALVDDIEKTQEVLVSGFHGLSIFCEQLTKKHDT